MPVPNVYIQQTETPLVAYNFIDVTRRTGYITFYPCAATNNSSTSYFLSTQQLTSSPVNVAATFDVDFDLQFAVPAIIEGDLILNFTVENTGSTGSISVACTIYHVDGSATETSLGTATTATFGPGTTAAKRECLKIAISRKTFKIGEKLRINCVSTAGGNGTKWMWINPANDTTSVYNFTDATTFAVFKVDTHFTADVPFKIDL